MDINNLPKEVLDLFPKWSYQCPKCGKQYDDTVQACMQCGTAYEESKWRVPPRFLKNYDTMSEYAHKVLAPKLTKKQRVLLFEYFTEFLNSGWEDSGGSDTTDDGKWTSEAEAGDGVVSVSSASEAVKSGTYGLSCYINDKNTDNAYLRKTISAQSEVYVRTYFKAENTMGGWSGHRVFRVFKDNIELLYVSWNNSAQSDHKWTLSYRKAGSIENISSYTNAPVADTWYCVEAKLLCSTADGNLDAECELWIDGESILSDTDYDSDYTYVDTIRVGACIYATWGPNYYYYDNVIIADTYIGPEEEAPAGAEAGFETGDTSEFDDTETSSGTITATDSVAHHGTYSGKCDVNGDGSAYAEGYFDVAEQQPVYCRGYFRFNQLPETNKDYTIICFENADTSTTVGYIQLIDDGGTKKWKMRRDTGSTEYSTSTSNIPEVDTWVCVEFAHGEDLAKLWVDGDELLSHTDASDQTIDRVHIGACNTDIDADDTLEIYIDCIVVTDEYVGPESEVGDLEVNNLTVNNVITVGEDTNLYRSAADTLKTDDNFVANEIQIGTSILATDESVLYVKESDESPVDLNVGTLTATQVNSDEIKTAAGNTYVWDLANMPNQGTNGYVLTAQGTGNPPVWASAGSGSVNWTAVPSSIIPLNDDTYDLGSETHAWQDIYGSNGHIDNLTTDQLEVDSTLYFGTEQDTNLYRSDANILKTDDKFEANEIQVGTSVLSTDESGALELGDSSQSNTKPYIDFHYGNSGSEDYNVRIQNDGDKQLNISAISSGGTLNLENMELTFEGDTKLYREALNYLKTDGSLAIEGTLYEYGNLRLIDYDVPELSKLEIVNAIYGFEDGMWNPEGFTPGHSYITFWSAIGAGAETQLFVIEDEQDNEPILTTNRGLVVQKDIAAGGFVSANQGELWLGSGRDDQVDVPKIILSNSNVSRLDGGGLLDIPPIPSGSSYPGDPVNGQLFIFTGEYPNRLYKYDGAIWQDKGPRSDFAGYFDTLYITNFDGTPAKLNTGIDRFIDTGCVADASGVEANHFCSITGNNTVGISDMNNSTSLHGVAVATKTQGESVQVIKLGRAQVVAGENLTAGDRVTTDQNGCAIKYNAHNHDKGTLEIGSGSQHKHTDGSLSVTVTGADDYDAHTVGGTTAAQSTGYDQYYTVYDTNSIARQVSGRSHYHGFTGGASANGTHDESMSGSTGYESSHTHELTSGFTGDVATGEVEYKVLVGATTGNLATIWVQ
ncbi:MAG: zinc ribbon domain-containing protein [Candidatus Bathyarchaeota archaeon]|nr:zinc ribbon domain-containing protein [Candidatus Bathyarchaeum sp.]